MNLLQSFMAAALLQVRGDGTTDGAVMAEEFTINGETPAVVRVGVFGGTTVIPVMTRQGYQDQEALLMTSEKALFATAPEPRIQITRTQTGEVFFVHGVDGKDPVLLTFTLTNRNEP